MNRLFIVGAAKAGTSALFDMVAQHPLVCAAMRKEPHYFSYGVGQESFNGPGDDLTINPAIIRSRDAYARLFDESDERVVCMEGSTSYLYHPEAAKRIFREEPGARVVAVLRDPVDRAYSSYMYMVSRGLEPLPFSEALAAEEERIAANWHHIWHYSRMGLYHEQLERYAALAEPRNLLVIEYNAFKAAPEETLRQIWELCGLGAVEVRTDLQRNRSGRPRAGALGAAAFQPSALKRALVRWVPDRPRRAISDALRSRLLTKERMDLVGADMVAQATRLDADRLRSSYGLNTDRWHYRSS
jgi:hypothetical protein